MQVGTMTGGTGILMGGVTQSKPYTIEFPDGLDTRNTDDVVITHNQNGDVWGVACTFLDTPANQSAGKANRMCSGPVITRIDNNSFSINGYIEYGFKLEYRIG